MVYDQLAEVWQSALLPLPMVYRNSLPLPLPLPPPWKGWTMIFFDILSFTTLKIHLHSALAFVLQSLRLLSMQGRLTRAKHSVKQLTVLMGRRLDVATKRSWF